MWMMALTLFSFHMWYFLMQVIGAVVLATCNARGLAIGLMACTLVGVPFMVFSGEVLKVYFIVLVFGAGLLVIVTVAGELSTNLMTTIIIYPMILFCMMMMCTRIYYGSFQNEYVLESFMGWLNVWTLTSTLFIIVSVLFAMLIINMLYNVCEGMRKK